MASRHLLIFIYLCEKQGGHLILHCSSDLNISNSTNFSFTYGELEGEWKEKYFPYSDVIFFVAGWKWKFWHYGSKSNHFPGTREHMFTDVWATHVKEQIIHLIILSIKKKPTITLNWKICWKDMGCIFIPLKYSHLLESNILKLTPITAHMQF